MIEFKGSLELESKIVSLPSPVSTSSVRVETTEDIGILVAIR